ncbi:MAG: S-layer homology domain-containing protein [Clostridia bacterium]|nr:S-layer homology domain-containing protein [Clostridia bacterium]
MKTKRLMALFTAFVLMLTAFTASAEESGINTDVITVEEAENIVSETIDTVEETENIPEIETDNQENHNLENKEITDGNEITDNENIDENKNQPEENINDDSESNINIENNKVDEKSPVSEENTETETVPDTSSKINGVYEYIESFFSDDCEISYDLNINTRKIYISETQKDNPLNISSQEKKIIADEMIKFYDFILDNTDENPDPSIVKLVRDKPKFINVSLRFYRDQSIRNTLPLIIRDNEISIRGVERITDNPEKIIDYLIDLVENKLNFAFGIKEKSINDIFRRNFDFDNLTIDGETLKLMEELDFDVKVTEEHFDTVFCDAAEVGTVAKCNLVRLFAGSTYFILTIEGNKDSIQLYKWETGWAPYKTDNISFDNHAILENNQLIYTYTSLTTRYQELALKNANFSKKTMDIEYKFKTLNNSITIPTFNVEHTAYEDDLYVQKIDTVLTTKKEDYFPEDEEKEGNITVTEMTPEQKAKKEKTNADVLNSLGLFKGTSKGYELDKSFTREESAVMLVRILGEEANVKSMSFDGDFEDVTVDRWSYPYVMYCYENGITKGTGENTFSPEAEVTAEEFAALVLRLMGYTETEPENALKNSVTLNILKEEFVEELKSEDFNRGDMVTLVYSCMSGKKSDGKILARSLADKSVITSREAERFEPKETEEIE